MHGIRRTAPTTWTSAAVLLFWSVCAAAQTAPAARDVVAENAARVLAGVSKCEVGLLVVDLKTGDAWCDTGADAPLKPASVMKLFTTAAALEHFGPRHNFETRFYLNGAELWAIGGGDPGLGDERIAARYGKNWDSFLDELAELLKARGVTSIDKIVLDDHAFDQEWRHPDWDARQFHAWYCAPVGALNLYDNCVDAYIDVANGVASARTTPALPAAFVRASLRVAKTRKPPILKRNNGSDIIEITGAAGRSAQVGTVSVGRPTVFFGHALCAELARRGVNVSGEVARREFDAQALATATPLATHKTSLADVLWRCNTYSQNFFAECLAKSLGAFGADGQPSGVPGSWENGMDCVRRRMEDLGVRLDGAVLRDGSGLSHKNRVTARQIVDLLRSVRARPYAELFRDSLAEPGADGTLRRFNAEELQGRVCAKTGTISNVRALAGYVSRDDGVELAFALLINGQSSPDIPKRLARALAE